MAYRPSKVTRNTSMKLFRPSNSGVVGHPELATAEKGRTYLEIVVQQLSQYFIELAKAELGKMYE